MLFLPSAYRADIKLIFVLYADVPFNLAVYADFVHCVRYFPRLHDIPASIFRLAAVK